MYIHCIDMKEQDVMLTIRISKILLREWDKFCETNNLSRSELIRISVNEKISNNINYQLQKIDELILHYFKSFEAKIQQQMNLILKKLERF